MPDDGREALDVVRVHDVGPDQVQDLAEPLASVAVPSVRDAPAELIDGRPPVAGREALVEPPAILREEPIYVDAIPPFDVEILVAGATRRDRHAVALRRQGVRE